MPAICTAKTMLASMWVHPRAAPQGIQGPQGLCSQGATTSATPPSGSCKCACFCCSFCHAVTDSRDSCHRLHCSTLRSPLDREPPHQTAPQSSDAAVNESCDFIAKENWVAAARFGFCSSFYIYCHLLTFFILFLPAADNEEPDSSTSVVSGGMEKRVWGGMFVCAACQFWAASRDRQIEGA